MKQVGIVGFGAFGQFMAKHLAPHADLMVCDRHDVTRDAAELGVKAGTLAEVASREIVLLAVPVQNLEEVLTEIRPHVRAEAIVADVSSVKVKPLEMMARLLPRSVELIGLHPLFGPQSGRDGIANLKVVYCPVRTTHAAEAQNFLAHVLGLQVIEITPEEHDRQMAYIQGLTHWFGRAVREMTVPDRELGTPAYQRFLEIEEMLRSDSDELFLTIARENPFAEQAREELLNALKRLHDWASGK
jgi:prephenate dehydrogenase